jgi:hypothetical protein
MRGEDLAGNRELVDIDTATITVSKFRQSSGGKRIEVVRGEDTYNVTKRNRKATEHPAYVAEKFLLYCAISPVAIVNIMTAPAYPTTVEGLS